MSVDLNLPTFGLDCREWLVATEADGLLGDESDGAPVVAILSTAVIHGAELSSAQAVLSLALIDDYSLGDGFELEADGGGQSTNGELVDPASNEVNCATRSGGHMENWAGQDICVLDVDWSAGYARFVVPAPGGELAVVAEFTSAPHPGRELVNRFYDLVTSFRWAA